MGDRVRFKAFGRDIDMVVTDLKVEMALEGESARFNIEGYEASGDIKVSQPRLGFRGAKGPTGIQNNLHVGIDPARYMGDWSTFTTQTNQPQRQLTFKDLQDAVNTFTKHKNCKCSLLIKPKENEMGKIYKVIKENPYYEVGAILTRDSDGDYTASNNLFMRVEDASYFMAGAVVEAKENKEYFERVYEIEVDGKFTFGTKAEALKAAKGE